MCEQCGPADDESIEEQVKSFLALRAEAQRQAAAAKAASATAPAAPSSNKVEASHA